MTNVLLLFFLGVHFRIKYQASMNLYDNLINRFPPLGLFKKYYFLSTNI